MAAENDADLAALVTRWAKGEITLKQIKGYTDDELYAIAHQGYFFLMQGKNEDARTIFEGLVAIDPQNAYYYRALGVIYHKLGDAERAIRQFTYATRVAPRAPSAYVNRAEVYVATGRRADALRDLGYALSLVPLDAADPLSRKARALLNFLT
ncbi:MAG: tetratricopeptide repeat protein [Deltaproteobacteria bacterium]|nr:tetratricopeptide repeat protein [Deltaproteobacteria bacterium]